MCCLNNLAVTFLDFMAHSVWFRISSYLTERNPTSMQLLLIRWCLNSTLKFNSPTCLGAFTSVLPFMAEAVLSQYSWTTARAISRLFVSLPFQNHLENLNAFRLRFTEFSIEVNIFQIMSYSKNWCSTPLYNTIEGTMMSFLMPVIHVIQSWQLSRKEKTALSCPGPQIA